MSWWESQSGTYFRQVMMEIIAGKKGKALITVTFDDLLDYIFLETRINPDVVKKWKKGGNPSMTNIEKIINTCNVTNAVKNKILTGLRDYKNPGGKTEPLTTSDLLQLKAIINQFDEETGKYWVRVYNKNRFVYGDRTSNYFYAKKMINTPDFRRKVIDKLGHNNFIITFNTEESIPQMK